MAKISIILPPLFFLLFTFSLAKILPENDVINPIIRLPSDQSNAVVKESSSDSNAVESTVTTVPLTAIRIRPINRRFPNKPCRHQNKIHPENQLQILSLGENFKDPEAIHRGSRPWMRQRHHHHRRHKHDDDSDSESDDDDEDDHYKRIGSKHFDKFDREKKMMMKKRFGPWEEHHKGHKRVGGGGGFMKRVKNFFEQYF